MRGPLRRDRRIGLSSKGTSDVYDLAATAGRESRVPVGARWGGGGVGGISAGSGVAGASVELNKPLLVSDPSQNTLLVGRVKGARKDIGSSIVVPLVTPESGPIGVLNLSRGAADLQFDEADVARVESLARHVALAVSNARFFARLNEALAQADAERAKLAAVLEHLGVAVLVVGSEGETAHRNPQAERLLGEGAPAALAHAVSEALRHAPDRKRAHDEETGRAWSLVAAPLPGGGATVAIEEITEHLRSARELARVRRLAEIGQMTAAVAHEVRNPLTSIRSAAQMIALAPEQAPEFAQMVEEEVLKLDALCEEFLAFARPLALRLRTVRLEDLVRQVAEGHRKQFVDAGVALEIEISPNVPKINADPPRVEGVVRNLLLNALQACGPGGTVRLSVGSDGFVVEDTGCGMPAESLERLFTPFFTTKAQGTGLGLSNVRKTVEAHGGEIEVRSEMGKGSRFEVRLGEGVAA